MTEQKPKKRILSEAPLGTVLRLEWEDEYIERVIIAESEQKRPICGAPKKDGSPCRGRPKKIFAYFCPFHRHSGKYTMGPSQATNALARPTGEIILLMEDEIRLHVGQCQCCVRKRDCSWHLPNSHCRIEERLYKQFVNSITENYDTQEIDLFMIHQAAQAYVTGFRARLAQSRVSTTEAEENRTAWASIRESQEFRNIMKELGLTPKERQRQAQGKVTASSIVPSNVSLAQLMAEAASADDEEVTVETATRITKKKKSGSEQITYD